jgi:hypothetical protein
MEPHGYLVIPLSAMEAAFGVAGLLALFVTLVLLALRRRHGAGRTGR